MSQRLPLPNRPPPPPAARADAQRAQSADDEFAQAVAEELYSARAEWQL